MTRFLQPALLLAVLAMMAAPALTPAFTGYDPATFPVRIDRPAIQPAGYAFSIWGVIYLWLLAHAAFGLFKRKGDPAFLRPALPLMISGLLGSVWLAIYAGWLTAVCGVSVSVILAGYGVLPNTASALWTVIALRRT